MFFFLFFIALISLPLKIPITFRTVTKLIFDFSLTLQEICRDSQSESIVILTISILRAFAVRLSHTTERILTMNANTTSSRFTLHALRTFTHPLSAPVSSSCSSCSPISFISRQNAHRFRESRHRSAHDPAKGLSV